MTTTDPAPALFVVLFALAVTGIVLELGVLVLSRIRGSSPVLTRIRRAARVAAPVGLVGAGLTLVWLSNAPDRAAGEDGAPGSGTPATTRVPIDAEGIGVARVGATLAEVRDALPAGQTLGSGPAPYLVDLDGVPVTEAADTLYVLLYLAGEPDHEDAPISMVATTSPRARTADEVGPGTSLAEARVRYGAPTLSYHVMDESREYARFPVALGERVLFRVVGVDGGFAGSYEGGGEYNETTDYDPAARISMVMVRLSP